MRTRSGLKQSRLFIMILLAVVTNPDLLPASTIGIYTDPAGSTCSFSGNNPGTVTAYIVVKPDASGVLSARFSAPVPSCFGGVFLYETPPDGASAIGNSQTDVSVAFPFCAIENEPAVLLEVNYYRSGSTAPCCEFPIVASSFVGVIEGVDCSFESVLLEPVTSHFNIDGSCPCSGGVPPLPPVNPAPMHGATDVSVNEALGWSADPSDNDIVDYDVYFGTASPPPFVSAVAQSQYQPSAMDAGTQYFWRVAARDIDGLVTSGPTWSFTTRPANSPPGVPVALNPTSAATNVPLDVTLQWQAEDYDQDPMHYDVYFGTVSNPPLIASGLLTTDYVLAPLVYSTGYFWKVVVHDSFGNATTGPVWQFTTRPDNLPPGPITTSYNQVWNQPFNQITLTWNVTDPDGDPMRYAVHLGPSGSPPPLVANNLTTKSYGPLNLSVLQFYTWYVVAVDDHFNTQVGPVWQFGTKANEAPVAQRLTPGFSTTVGPDFVFQWEGSDPDGDIVHYDVYFGPQPDQMTRIASNLTTTSFDPGEPPVGTYYWSLSFWDVHGNGSQGNPYSTGAWPFIVSSPTAADEIPVALALGRNHPNPFNPQTIIPYGVPNTGGTVHVRLVIYDMSGRLVRTLVDEEQRGGSREVLWRGDDASGRVVTSGVYFCVLDAGGERRTQKLVLLK